LSVVLKFVRLDPCDEQFQREMFERTVRDALTGLYNRTYFLTQVGPLAEFNAVRELGLAVLMLDIDHFKRINDTYGHDVGDHVLREVACVLREATRSEDLVARYGGEEFILALPVSAPDQATERAERIRTTLAERRIISGGISLRVTASLGLAFASPPRLCSASAMITAADRCLYQAKNAGRNRISFQAESPVNCWGSGSTAMD
jgi:diguanylate cyclase (GGDEF)-like protein